MKCTNCGNKIAKKEAFCAACGIPVSQMPKKKTSPVLLALSIVLALSLIANVVLAMGKPASNKLEGKGFRSPEAAITAYAEAFAAGDVAGMLSTFAIESYVAHFDLEEQLAANAFYHFYQAEVGLPNDGVYKTQLNHYTRLAALTTQIKNGYYTLTEIDNSKAIIPFQRSTMEEEIEELMEQLEDPKFDQKLSSMRIGNVLTEEDFDCDAKA